MSKDSKIIIFSVLLVFVMSAFMVLIGTSMATTRSLVIQGRSKQVDLVKLDQDYRQQVKKIVMDYSNLQDSISAERVDQLKEQLLALMVPAKFRDLHYNLIFAMDKMVVYLKNGDNQDKLTSQTLISQAKTEYSWLN